MSETEGTTAAPESATPSADGLPTMHPSWCRSDEHEKALAEGCTRESAGIHWGPAMSGRLNDLVQPFSKELLRPGKGGWDLRLVADPYPGLWGLPRVEMEVDAGFRPSHTVELHLTGSEARTLARQLERLADLYDLEGI